MRIYGLIVVLLFLSACGGEPTGGNNGSNSSSSSSSGSGFVHSAATCNLSMPENWPCSWTDSNGSVWGCSGGQCSYPLPGWNGSSSSSSGGAVADCPDGSNLPPASAYPLGYSSQLNVWSTLNGGFESMISHEAITFNTDPLYVLSGEASAQFGDYAFRGHLYTESLGAQTVIEEGSFHIYSLSDQTEEYVFDLTEYIPECGTDGVGQKVFQKTFTAPPNTWFAVSIDAPIAPNGKDLILTIRKVNGDEQEFYLDDVNFSGTH